MLKMNVKQQFIKWDQYPPNQSMIKNGSNIKIDDPSSVANWISSSTCWHEGIHRFDIQCIKPALCRIGLTNDNQYNLFTYWSNGFSIKMSNFEIPTKTLNTNHNSSRNTYYINNTSTLSWNTYDFIGMELNCTDPNHPNVTFFKNNIAITDPINILKYNTYHPVIQILKSPCHYDLNPFIYTTTYHIGETIEFIDTNVTEPYWYRGRIVDENYETCQYNISYGKLQIVSRHKYSKQIAKLHTHIPLVEKIQMCMPVLVHSHAIYIHLAKRNKSYIVFKATGGLVYMYNTNKKICHEINVVGVEHIAFNGKKYLFLLTSTQCFVFNIHKKITKQKFDLPKSKFSVNSCFIPYPFNGIYRIASTGLHYKIDVKNGNCMCLGMMKKPEVKRWKLLYNHGKRVLFLFYFHPAEKKTVYGIDIKQVNHINGKEIKSLNSYSLNNICLQKIVNKLAKKTMKEVYVCNILDNICFIGYDKKYSRIQQVHCYDFVTDNMYSVKKNMECVVQKLITTSNGHLLMFAKNGTQYKTNLMSIMPSKVVELQRKRIKFLISVYLKFIKKKNKNIIIPTELEQMIFLFYPWFI